MDSRKTQQKQGQTSLTPTDAGSTLDSTAGAAEPVKCAAAAIAASENKRDKFDQPGHVRFQVCSRLPQNSYRDKKQRSVQHSCLNIPA